MVVFLVFGVFLAGLATVLVARAVAMPRTRIADSLAQISSYGYEVPLPPTEEVVSADSLRGTFDRSAGVLGTFLERHFDSIKESEIRRVLVAAGMYRTSPRTFLGYQALALVAGVLVGLWWARSTDRAFVFVLASAVGGGYIGFRLPRILLRQRAKRRMSQIEDELPDLIDILVVTIEAGLGFVASLQLAAQRLTGPLGDELRLTLQEQRMGLGTSEALRNLLARCETPGIMAFVRSMLQGEQLGVSVGQIMRDLAREMRVRRRQMAEERAQKAPIKILFPLVFLIFPAMFLVILYPAMKAILDTL